MEIIKKKPYYDECIYCEGWQKFYSTKIKGDPMTSIDCVGKLNKKFCCPEKYNWLKDLQWRKKDK